MLSPVHLSAASRSNPSSPTPCRHAAKQSSRLAPSSAATRYALAHSSFARSNWPSAHDARAAVSNAPARPGAGKATGVGVDERGRVPAGAQDREPDGGGEKTVASMDWPVDTDNADIA